MTPRMCISAGKYLRSLASVFQELPDQPLEPLVEDLMDVWRRRRLIFVCGNGGSAANASHLVEDIGKSTVPAGQAECPRFRIISLSENTPYILAWANDDGFDRVFVEQLINLASPGDLLLAISASGRSENVLRAAEWAGRNGLLTWAMTGQASSPLLEHTDRAIRVPSENVGVIETAHLAVIHWMVDELRARLEDACTTEPRSSKTVSLDHRSGQQELLVTTAVGSDADSRESR